MDPTSTPNPSQYMAENLDFQDFADSENMVVVLPESGVWNMMGMESFMANRRWYFRARFGSL